MTDKTDKNDSGQSIRMYIENGKFYLTIIESGKTFELFNKTPLRGFTYEKEGGAGAFFLILLTTDGDVYKSSANVGYTSFNSNFKEDNIKFEYTAIKHVETIIATYQLNSMNSKKFYAIDSTTNRKYIIEEPPLH